MRLAPVIQDAAAALLIAEELLCHGHWYQCLEAPHFLCSIQLGQAELNNLLVFRRSCRVCHKSAIAMTLGLVGSHTPASSLLLATAAATAAAAAAAAAGAKSTLFPANPKEHHEAQESSSLTAAASVASLI